MIRVFQRVFERRSSVTKSPRPDLSNGELLRIAEVAGFELMVTTDKNVRYQQNLIGRKISIVVLGNSPWWLVRKHLDVIVTAVNAAVAGSYAEVDIPFERANH